MIKFLQFYFQLYAPTTTSVELLSLRGNRTKEAHEREENTKMSQKRVLILHSQSLETKSTDGNEIYLSIENTSADVKSKIDAVGGIFDEVKCTSG